MLTHQNSASQVKVRDVNLSHLSTESAVRSAIETSDDDSSIKLAEQLHSDLVPAKYEGKTFLLLFVSKNQLYEKNVFIYQGD